MIKRTLLLLLGAAVILAGCADEPEVDVEATVAAAIAATQTAAPTDTPIPPTDTPTPEPTDTPTPEPTDTPTPEPTDTPTPEPTDTSTSEPTSNSISSSSIIQTELESGGTLYELPDEGFSIALPEDWEVLNLDEELFAAALGVIGEQNEALAGVFTNRFFQSLIVAGVKFYAINVSQESLSSNSPANISIVKQELPLEFTLDQYASLNVAQLEQFFDLTSEIEQEQVILGDVETVKIAYSANLVDMLGKSLEISNTQYLFLDDSFAYVITLSMPVELADDYLPASLDAVETFRLIK